MALARQYSLGLSPPPARLSLKDFVVADSNRAALETLKRWHGSAEPLLVIAGPEASGKTHLLHILADTSGGEVVDFDTAASTRGFGGAVQIVDRISGGAQPSALLSLIERARETGRRLALAGKGEPQDWAQGLRDLETRLGGAVRIDLVEPDEALLQAVIAKLLGDRQLRAGADLVAYATARLPRTFAAAQAFVAGLDASSIAEGAPAGLRIARAVIANLSEEAQPA